MKDIIRREAIRKYVDASLNLADAISVLSAEDILKDPILRQCEYSSRSLVRIFRDGVHVILSLQTMYEESCQKVARAESDAKDAQDILEEIFGERHFADLDVGIIEAVKAKLKPLNLHEEVNRLCMEYNDGK